MRTSKCHCIHPIVNGAGQECLRFPSQLWSKVVFFMTQNQGFKEEIDGLQEELEVVQNLGTELMTACGEPDKPIMKKSLDEVERDKKTNNYN